MWGERPRRVLGERIERSGHTATNASSTSGPDFFGLRQRRSLSQPFGRGGLGTRWPALVFPAFHFRKCSVRDRPTDLHGGEGAHLRPKVLPRVLKERHYRLLFYVNTGEKVDRSNGVEVDTPDLDGIRRSWAPPRWGGG